jgi:hypothetical protein
MRLSVLMELYIHPLYVLVSKIFSSILNSLAPIHSLYHPLSTLSTVRPTCHFYLNSFKGFIKMNLMVQSKFNLDFWFVGYSFFFFV